MRNLLICFFVLFASVLFAPDFKTSQENPGIVFSHVPGFYTEAIEIEIQSQSTDAVYFTFNGSEPYPGSEGCFLYQAPIKLENRSSEANGISMIRASPEDIYYKWAAPEVNIFKANVIRAKAFH